MKPGKQEFWSRVRVLGEDDCWPWLGACSSSGHGSMRYRGIHFIASRLAYWFENIEDPGDQLVCHHCDNPPCCNPRHLYLGDKSRNGLDAHARGLHPPTDRKGESNGRAKLTESDVRQIRRRIAGGETNVAISKDYGVTHQMISKIRRGRFWRHVKQREVQQ